MSRILAAGAARMKLEAENYEARIAALEARLAEISSNATKARQAVERLANTKMDLSLSEWSELSSAILSALEATTPVQEWEGPLTDEEQGMIDAAWETHKAASPQFLATEDGEFNGNEATPPAPTVTDEMVSAACDAFLRANTTVRTVGFKEMRAALKAAMEAGHD